MAALLKQMTLEEKIGQMTPITNAPLWVFAPVLNLGLNVYWPRFYETYGEDPLVAAELGAAYGTELQNNKDILPYKVAASGPRRLEDGFFTLRVGDQHQRFRYAGATAQAVRPASNR